MKMGMMLGRLGIESAKTFSRKSYSSLLPKYNANVHKPQYWQKYSEPTFIKIYKFKIYFYIRIQFTNSSKIIYQMGNIMKCFNEIFSLK